MSDNTTDATNSTSYAPPGEGPAELFIERTNFNGVTIGTFLYGVHFTLFLIALHYFLSGKQWNRVQWGMVTYVVLLFSAASVYTGSNIKWGEQMFIDDRNYPGGPLGFYFNAFNTPMIILGNSAFIVTNFLADSLVLYRTWIVWQRNFLVLAFPLLIFAGSTVMSILVVYQLAKPDAHFFSNVGLSLTIPYFSLSMALNIILTLMIAGKLLLTRNRLRTVLGDAHAKLYTGIAAMLVESAALYSTFSILFIATYSVNNAVFNDFLAMQSQIMCISPLLIIIRVARGHAYSPDLTSGNVSTRVFNSTDSQQRSGPMVATRTETFHMQTWPTQNETAVGTESMTKIRDSDV
ncbi:hypothetical protein EXIGLDRAFT_254144 [Exidia glandulosa HHB12029]|uniref:Uncharacterized protein n=1 Tax=Exidia glandulosa HHB12029 TaxID=1314781 RepID=A0A165DWW5_EXIGL|nr:hypothetical protein EXIGLDRAFT_254144 [Exidia glandulosa HHB12029]